MSLFSFHSSCLWKTVSFAARWSGTCSCLQMRWTLSSCKTLRGKRPCSRSSDGSPVGGAHWKGVWVGWGGDGLRIMMTEEEFLVLMDLCRVVSLIAFRRIDHLHWAAIIWNQCLTSQAELGLQLTVAGFVSDGRNTSSALLFELNNKHCCVSYKIKQWLLEFFLSLQNKKYFIYILIGFFCLSDDFYCFTSNYDLLLFTFFVHCNKIKAREFRTRWKFFT